MTLDTLIHDLGALLSQHGLTGESLDDVLWHIEADIDTLTSDAYDQGYEDGSADTAAGNAS